MVAGTETGCESEDVGVVLGPALVPAGEVSDEDEEEETVGRGGAGLLVFVSVFDSLGLLDSEVCEEWIPLSEWDPEGGRRERDGRV